MAESQEAGFSHRTLPGTVPRNRILQQKPVRNVHRSRGCLVASSVKGPDLLLFLLLLLLFLFLLVVFLRRSSISSLLLTLRSFGISSLLAWPLAEPLGQLLGGALGELLELLLPDGIEGLGTDDLPATLVQLLPVLVGPGVGPPLVLGVHADHGGVLANKGLGVKTLFQGLLPQLSLLPLLQLLEVPLLLLPLLLVVVLVSLQLDDNVEQLSGLCLEVIRVHGIEVKGLNSDGKGDLLLFLKLLLGLSGPLVSLLFPQFLLLFLLLLVELLLLLGPDLLPLGLLLLQLLQLLFLLLPGR